MAIPNYLSNVTMQSISTGTAIKRLKNLTWSYPDGTVLEDGNDNKEKPEFIRVVKSGRVEFSFECRDVGTALANYDLGGSIATIVFVEYDAKNTQAGANTYVEFSDSQWMGIEHNVAWGELASTTLRGVGNTVAVTDISPTMLVVPPEEPE